LVEKMTLINLVKLFKTEVSYQIKKKIVGSITFKIDLFKGGIGGCDIKIDKSVKSV